MSRSSLSSGRLTTGKVDVIATPPRPAPRPVVVVLHTAATDASEAVGVSFPSVGRIVDRVSEVDFTIVAPTTGHFENITGFVGGALAQQRVQDAINHARDELDCTDEPVVLMGGSQGSAAAIRYAALNPGEVACVITWLTLANLTYAYDEDVGGFHDEIGQAFGLSPAQTAANVPLPANSDPATMTDDLVDVPMLFHHSDDDDFSTGIAPHNHPWPIEDFADDVNNAGGNCTLVTSEGLGHTEAAIQAVDIGEVVEFIKEHVG